MVGGYRVVREVNLLSFRKLLTGCESAFELSLALRLIDMKSRGTRRSI